MKPGLARRSERTLSGFLSSPRIGLLAGEASGDVLGADLIRAVRERRPDARFEGIAGPRMQAAGCRALADTAALSVMGFSEVLGRLPGLLRLRRRIVRHFIDHPPDVVVGIDAPDFNLGLERRLKRAGVPTLHYVSPSVWAWRRYRVRKIARSTDRLLTLLPFEAACYRDQDIDVEFVGHPLADIVADNSDRQAARADLGLELQQPCIALLPGSRRSEVERLLPLFLRTARWCTRYRPGLQFVIAAATLSLAEECRRALNGHADDIDVRVVEGRSQAAMTAADAVLLASGTATLECLLLKRPMVVAYRLHPFSYHLARRLMRVPWVSLPNNLAGRALVPEYLQGAAQPARLGRALLDYLEKPAVAEAQVAEFARIHRQLKRNASARAAQCLLEVCDR